VVQLIVFCAFIGMVLAVPGVPGWQDWGRMLAACAGIWLVAAAAAAFNCLVERSIDARMKRTAWRPTARGELSHSQALLFSALLCAAGAAILLLAVNALTLWLTLATFIGYAVIYTLVLKPLTPQNIVIGGASGAMPPVLGWAAMTGQVGHEALLLFSSSFSGRRRISGRWRCTEWRTTAAPACPCCRSRMAMPSRGCRCFSIPWCCLPAVCCLLWWA
jgi:protoheme IX farnesyltransferase